MQTNQLIEFARRWSKMNAAHIEQRVAAWDGGYGLLFVGPEQQTAEAVEFMREYLKPDTVLRFDGQRKSEWREKTDFLFEKESQQSLFEESPSRVGVVTEGLDRASEWLHTRLKSVFERAVLPVVLLATAAEEGEIPDYLLSHYYVFHATSKKRKVSDEYKALPPRLGPEQGSERTT